MKSYTDLEQSKKLAEILPLESADMYWWSSGKRYYIEAMDDGDFNEEEGHIRAWSLAALLNYLKSKNKFPEIKELSDGRFALTTYIWDGEDCIQNSIGVTIVDACYDIIIKLHEQNLL